jgi:hypothetical protein
MIRVRICTNRCRCHSNCRGSRFSGLGTQIRGKLFSRSSLSSSREDPDAYAVYSAVLSIPGPWEDSKSLVILKELPPKEWPIGSPQDALQGNEEFRGIFESIFKAFEQTNKGSLFLENRFAIHKSYQLVGLPELEAAFHTTVQASVRGDGWEGFRRTLPTLPGI